MTLRLAAVALALAFPLSGCAVAALGAAGAVGVTAVQDKTMGEALDDATTSNEIKAKLLSESANRFGEVDVEVAGGLVLLSGRVDDPTDRVEAEGIAWTSSRAHDVANEIKIEPAGGFLANMSDELITGRVRARLVGSSKVKSLNYNVETYDGVVYLMGTARTAEELKQAAEEASVVGGVRQVVSYVRIRGDAQNQPAPTTQATPSYNPVPDATYGTQTDAELLGVSY
ncbi:BON domain-containing protein [Hyphomonas johnsonii]|uniref:Phospholipid-binding protein n=1 Tax=Hyphomonas johnsonii MHS-2 TaxID=1280950 RepID=A0A059FHN5_9PROT|nr:BON domain-containing protein [Hyphomonas johnsonii]KCZ90008.1 phospholipid-binding protein [Hyphomonas johnsonii MHS-2]